MFTHESVPSNTTGQGGLLAGKKVVIQPNMSARGWITDAGSLALEGFIALEDATVVTRLKEAGAILTGSTCMSELGFGLTGDTGVQVLSAGEADIALITDTMGEARVAASTSGMFAFKPSFGIVSRYGLIGLIPSMECYGILSKNLEDIITAVRVIAGKDENDFSMPEEQLLDFNNLGLPSEKAHVIGVIRECTDMLKDREVKAFRAGLERLEKAGLAVKEINLERYNLFRVVHNVVGSVEASSSAGKYDGVRYGHRSASGKNWNDMYLNSRGESFGPLIKAYLFQGAYFQFENYLAFENACRIRRSLVQDAIDLFNDVQMLAFPTRRIVCGAAKAATINATYDAFTFTLPANITGQPSLQIPSIAEDSGDDLGLQLVSPRLQDGSLLGLGMQLLSLLQG